MSIQQTILSDAKIAEKRKFNTIIANSGAVHRKFNKITIFATRQKTILSNAIVKIIGEQKTILSNAKIIDRYQKTILSDAKIIDRYQKTILSDAKVFVAGDQKIILSDSKIADQYQKNLLSDAIIIAEEQRNILSDAKIKVFDIQQTILSNAKIIDRYQQNILSDTKVKIIDIQNTILSDAKIKVFADQKTILSNAKIITLYQKVISSNANIKVIGDQKTILSNAKVAILVLVDFNNKIRTTKQVLVDINNKVNTVILTISDISNFINTCNAILSDVINDFRTQKLVLNNINNDIRFMYSWQKAADGSLQSLGKSYIRVYIGGIEQTDVDVDSISILKDLSTSHTATFDLGRAYDATKPAVESVVLIKYNDWILFSGYITKIAPTDSPEKIRINCQDEYWKQNKSNVYYHVGHVPTDNKELYYNTPSLALTAQHSWIPGIGNFIPEVMDNFAVGKSDAITNLIQECGNYGWFYDVNNNKMLWTAGQGSIIELNRQLLGENINLYNVINHSFDESVDDIVNKLRVQMGNTVIKKFDSTGGNKTYSSYYYLTTSPFVSRGWNSSYEHLAKESSSGYGYDHPDPDYAKEYNEVFKKYKFHIGIQPNEGWSVRYAPTINIFSPYGIGLNVYETIEDGFTIDLEKETLIFNDIRCLYYVDSDGRLLYCRAPNIRLNLWLQASCSRTNSPTDNPETDISNPLMFFTDKMGTYPDTIIKDLNLSTLSIQVGGERILPDGTIEYIPSWDDTTFAHDIADWNLSKTCDKKISGNIEITLDTACFYNIDLSKRIFINGITEEPMNILGINYNISNFTVSLQLENSRYYNRTVSFGTHGE